LLIFNNGFPIYPSNEILGMRFGRIVLHCFFSRDRVFKSSIFSCMCICFPIGKV